MKSPEGFIDSRKEQFTAEYVRKISAAVESGELEPTLADSRAFKVAFANIAKEARSPGDAAQQIGALIAAEAGKTSIPNLRNMVENPHLFQAFFAAREKSEGDIDVGARRDWIRSGQAIDLVSSPDNESGALMQALALAYVSKDLDEEQRRDFISTSACMGLADDLGESMLASDPGAIIYDRLVTERNNLEKLMASANDFRSAANRGREVDIYGAGADRQVREAFGDFYHMFGNRVDPFLKAVSDGKLFEYGMIERGLRDAIFYHKDDGEYVMTHASRVMEYYVKQLGLSEEVARERLSQEFGITKQTADQSE